MKLQETLFCCILVATLPYLLVSQSAYEEAAFFHGMVPERLVVLIISRLGLANRLRALADWYQIAQMSNRTLLVSWQATPDCNAKFTDLFIDGPPRFRVLEDHLPPGKEGVRYVEQIANKRNISNYPIYFETDQNFFVDEYKSFIISPEIPLSDAEVIITHYDGAVSLRGVHCRQYMMIHSHFLSSLVPNEEAQEFIRAMKRDHFQHRIMVGVHFRAHDPVLDWAVVPPLKGNVEAKTFGAGSTVEKFIETMAQIQYKFAYTDQNGVQKSLVRFFVASNNETEKAKFQSVVPDGIFLSGDHKRGTENGMQLALIEWLALSQSDLILNTYGSSFGEQAAHVHRKPLVGIWDGLLVHHLSVHLPFCGHMQFVKAYSALGEASQYREGSTDNRIIKGVSIPMRYSPILSQWGLEVLTVTSDEDVKAK